MAGEFYYTKMNDWQIKCLIEAGASGLEFGVYTRLVRPSKEDKTGGKPYKHWLKQEDFANLNGINRRSVTRALNNLCKKVFYDQQGNARTVLTKLSRGHKGKCAEYRDNIAMAYDGKLPPDSGETPPDKKPQRREDSSTQIPPKSDRRDSGEEYEYRLNCTCQKCKDTHAYCYRLKGQDKTYIVCQRCGKYEKT